MIEELDETRLRRLVEVGATVSRELDVERVLSRVLEVARDLTQARYAALGILDEHKRELERFLTLGIDEHVRREIGDLPRGRGVLGLLIQDPKPLRLHDVGEHPRSYGFPPGHPPMRSFLGVPIQIRGEAFGNLYLAEKRDGDFDAADEAAVVVLAEWAAVAIDNARLYETAEGRREELETAVLRLQATVAISRALGGETDMSRVLELIAKRARALVEARAVVILSASAGSLSVEATAGELRGGVRGTRIPLAGTVAERVLASGQAERVADVADRMSSVAAALGLDATTALIAPLAFRGRMLGVLQAYDRTRRGPDFTSDDVTLLESFAASAATAVATAQSVERARLEQSIQASEQERRRWARELHDETLQGLGALRLLLSTSLRGDADDVRSAAERVIEQLDVEIENLRMLVTELRPAALDELGLEPALRSLIERTTMTADLDAELHVDIDEAAGRLAPDVESTLYRLVQEAVRNVVRHSGASTLRVSIVEEDGIVNLTVRDDGRGFDSSTPAGGFGLVGMQERADLVDGRLSVSSSAGAGTVVEGVVPARRSSVAASGRLP